MLRVGEKVGGYEIVAKLRSGGMAALFLAVKQGASGFRRHVAVKVVHEHLASDPEFIRMFVDEALLQARIQNPHVVHVEELGEADGNHFLVMEYVHGCSLSQLLLALGKRGRRLTPELATAIAMQVLAGLHAAHELRGADGRSLGVVHRDVSPQNILLSRDGHVKLIDFGVAKASGRAAQTTGASIKGKLRYMPPEQAFGGAIDRRADVYALGIVLWEVLTMRRLFHAESDLALLEMVRDPHVIAPSEATTGLGTELDAVVLKALAKRPEDRFASAQEFRRALAEVCPRAAMLDPQWLAELIEAVLGEEIERERRALPPAIGEAVGPAIALEARAEEVVLTMTVSSTGLVGDGRASGAGPISASVGGQHEAAEALAAPLGIAMPDVAVSAPTAILPAIAATPAPAAPTAPVSFEAPPTGAAPRTQERERDPSSARWLVLGALIVAALAATGWAIFGGARSDEVIATPLASTPVEVTPPVLPPPAEVVPPPAPEVLVPPSRDVVAPRVEEVAPPPTDDVAPQTPPTAGDTPLSEDPRRPVRPRRPRRPADAPEVPFSTEF